MSELSRIQRWLQAVITHPRGVAAGLESPAARAEIDLPAARVEEVVTRSQSLDSVGRLEVYASAYYSRLLECLREEFPVLAATAGEDAFNDLAFGYLQQHPSTSYSLNHLAGRFPEYLAETRPAREPGDDASVPDWADFLIDLATLELHFSQVFDGPGAEQETLLAADGLRAIDPERWPDSRLVPVPCLRVVPLRFPLNDYYAAIRRGESPDIPAPRVSWLAITRRNYIVRRHELSHPQFVLLQSILSGATVGEAIIRAAEQVDDVNALEGQLRDWFRQWCGERFFVSVQ